MENTYNVTADNILKTYGEKTALKIDHLEIKQGACFGLAGNNGAGKTTFFRALLDLIPLDKGVVKLGGISVAEDESWKQFTGAYLDEGFLIDYLTPDEYFDFSGLTLGVSKADVNAHLKRFEPIFNGEIIGTNNYIRDLSMGNRKKTGIAAAFIGNPKIVILDEPFANLDPSSQFHLREIIREIATHENITVLISSHDLSQIAEISSRIVILNEGKIIKDITKTSSQTLSELEQFFKRV